MNRIYLFKKRQQESYRPIEQFFNGLKILKIEGFLEKGKPLNVYHQQWNDSQDEDYMICSNRNGTIIYENKDISIDFIICNQYSNNKNTDIVRLHEAFINYMTTGETFIASSYVNMEVRTAFIGEYKPSLIKLNREKSYILGTLVLHKLSQERIIS